jgi:predicted CoA-binding protein
MPQQKTTLVLGASENPERYSNMAVKKLRAHGHTVAAIGGKPGQVGDVAIITGTPALENIDTITMYLGAARQPDYYSYILSLKPRRIIFNPGAENDELAALAAQHNIETMEACTLVLLSTAQYGS